MSCTPSSIFVIDERTKYTTKFRRIDNIEDAGDEFFSLEEMHEIVGDNFYCHNEGSAQNTPAIVAELADWKNKLIASGKKTIVITDVELVDVLTNATTCFASDFVAGVRRVGNRLSLAPEKALKKVADKRDFSRLVNVCHLTINKGQKYDFSLTYCNDDRVGALTLLKKLLKWEDLAWSEFKFTTEEHSFMQEIWDNPAMFDKAPT